MASRPSPRPIARAIDWLKLQQMFGKEAARYVAQRIGALALVGDVEGVERFQAIASRMEQLLSRDQHRC